MSVMRNVSHELSAIGNCMRVVDLTHPLNDRSPNWEGSEASPFRAQELGNIDRDGYYSRIFSTQEHYGTHLDAPAHFCADGWTVDEIPADRLVRPLVVLDVRESAADESDYAVTADDVASWERDHGKIPAGAVVIAYTGWDQHWQAPKRFRNPDSDGVTHYPGFSLEAARFLVAVRGVVGLGIDTMSVDIGATSEYPVHVFTSPRGIYHLENVANLATVPASGATIVVAPIKLEKGSGGPVRLLALIAG
jgi:kynurenine formamidase